MYNAKCFQNRYYHTEVIFILQNYYYLCLGILSAILP